MKTRKPKPTPRIPDNADDKEQSERFVKAVQEHEADESGSGLSDAFSRIMRTPAAKKSTKDTRRQ